MAYQWLSIFSFLFLSIASANDGEKAPRWQEMREKHEKCMKEKGMTQEQMEALKTCSKMMHKNKEATQEKKSKEEWKKEMEAKKEEMKACLKENLKEKFDEKMLNAMKECRPHPPQQEKNT